MSPAWPVRTGAGVPLIQASALRAGRQGWCPTIIDTNGDGVIGDYVGPRDPVDSARDKRIEHISYGIIPNPVDGSIWYAAAGVPGQIVRMSLGDSPPETCIAEVYEPPFENPQAPGQLGYTPRGIDVDRNGLIWTALGGSAHIASFDRGKCAVLNGPTATGQHCPEGWTLYQTPGPQMKNVNDPGNADFLYYLWVDQFNTSGLGANVPIAAAPRPIRSLPCCLIPRRWSSYACRTRSGSSRDGSTAASTTRTPDGRAEGCGRTSRRSRCGTWRAERAPRGRS